MKFWHVILCTSVFAIFLLGAPLEDWFPSAGDWHFLAQLGGGLGEALTIAVFLALTVDTYVKHRLAKEIAKDVSPYIATALLPSKLRSEIRDLSIINLYRSKVRFEYTILPLEGHADFVGVTADSSFTVHNVSADNAPHQHFVAVQKPFLPMEPIKQMLHVRAIGVLNTNKTKGDYDLISEDGDEDLGKDNKKTNQQIWSKNLLIPPNSQAQFASKTFQILPAEHAETCICIMASIGATIQVRYPEGMNVTVTIGHRLRDRVAAKPKRRPDTWEFNEAVLPFQPIVIEWRNTPTPAAPAKAGTELPPR